MEGSVKCSDVGSESGVEEEIQSLVHLTKTLKSKIRTRQSCFFPMHKLPPTTPPTLFIRKKLRMSSEQNDTVKQVTTTNDLLSHQLRRCCHCPFFLPCVLPPFLHADVSTDCCQRFVIEVRTKGLKEERKVKK
jgi:hypothetical protein